jgi:hypothetical protein
MILSNLALSSASAPLLGLLLLAAGKAVSRLKSKAAGVGFSRACRGRTLLLSKDYLDSTR